MLNEKFKEYREFYDNLYEIMRMSAVKSVSQADGRKLVIELE